MNLISPTLLKQKLPLTPLHQYTVSSQRQTVCHLLSQKDPRIALIFGPCSIHDIPSALDYAKKFKLLASRVKKECVCIMRVYIEKPRTTLGWKGFVYDPNLDGSNDLQKGIIEARELFITLTQMGIPIATEILSPLLFPFFSDLITWGFIGARTSASQTHREIASDLPFPVGFKNSPEGSISQAMHSVIATREPQSFPMIGEDGFITAVETAGNPFAHVVLRGSHLGPNYDAQTVASLQEELLRNHLPQGVMIDCSHDNSGKNVDRQKAVFFEVLENYLQNSSSILGMMLESHLEEGAQRLVENPSNLQYGLSITDPCMSWKDTEQLVLYASECIASSVMR
ncbi:MAG: 3-deoxy-7-phosphoheptulonate synthase [Candidatus Rhabdochlamydia sp.]